jgi:hypothetical protein
MPPAVLLLAIIKNCIRTTVVAKCLGQMLALLLCIQKALRSNMSLKAS